MDHKEHNHPSCCKHEHVRFCQKCGVPYCEDCGKEWFEKCTLSHYYPWYCSTTYPLTAPQTTWGITDAQGNTTSGTYQTVCSHTS